MKDPFVKNAVEQGGMAAASAQPVWPFVLLSPLFILPKFYFFLFLLFRQKIVSHYGPPLIPPSGIDIAPARSYELRSNLKK